MAIIATVFANAHRGKNQPAFKVEDFMPKFETTTGQRQTMVQTDEQMLAMMRSVFPGPLVTTKGQV